MDEAEAYDAMREISEELDLMIHQRLDETIDAWDENIALGVMVSVGTSLIAKAVLLAPEEHVDNLGKLITKTIAMKLAEGRAALEGDKAIQKAKNGF